jgi:hypothetical protein
VVSNVLNRTSGKRLDRMVSTDSTAQHSTEQWAVDHAGSVAVTLNRFFERRRAGVMTITIQQLELYNRRIDMAVPV